MARGNYHDVGVTWGTTTLRKLITKRLSWKFMIDKKGIELCIPWGIVRVSPRKL